MIDFIKNNWVFIITSLIGIAEIIVRLTPTKKDNSIVNIIKQIFDVIIKNKKAAGGYH